MHSKHLDTALLTKAQIRDRNLSKAFLHPGSHPDAVVTAWMALQFIGGHVLLVLLLLTFLISKKISRHITLYNLLITFIIAGIIDSMLLYANRWRLSDESPSQLLCLMQASLIYGVPPMNAASAFALIYQMWMTLYRPSTISARESPAAFKNQRFRTALLLMAPYFAFVLAGVPTFVVGFHEPDRVSRQRRMFYCSVLQRTLTNSLGVFTGLICCLTAFFQVWAVFIIHRSWRRLSTVDQKAGSIDRQTAIRVSFFGFYVLLGLVLSFLSIWDQHTVIPDMFVSTIPPAIFLIFATQSDVLRIWAEWLHIDGIIDRLRGKGDRTLQSTESFDVNPSPTIAPVSFIGRSSSNISSSYSRMKENDTLPSKYPTPLTIAPRPLLDTKRRPDDEESRIDSVRDVVQVGQKTPALSDRRLTINANSPLDEVVQSSKNYVETSNMSSVGWAGNERAIGNRSGVEQGPPLSPDRDPPTPPPKAMTAETIRSTTSSKWI